MKTKRFKLNSTSEAERIAKRIARAGVCSRREAEARSPLATLSVDSPGKPPVQKRIRKLIQRRNVAAACRLFE